MSVPVGVNVGMGGGPSDGLKPEPGNALNPVGA